MQCSFLLLRAPKGAQVRERFALLLTVPINAADLAGLDCQYSRETTCNGKGTPTYDGLCICDTHYTGAGCTIFDNVSPSISIYPYGRTITRRLPITFTAQGSEDMDLTAAALTISVTRGSLSNWTLAVHREAYNRWSIAISSMEGAGVFSIALPAGSVYDAARNPNVASQSTPITFGSDNPVYYQPILCAPFQVPRTTVRRVGLGRQTFLI